MPSIEIVSVNSKELELSQNEFDFAIIVENEKIHSHRSLFFDFLEKLNGTIIHIGNPEFKNNGYDYFFAGKIIDWNSDTKKDFKFLPEYEESIFRLLKIAQEKSLEKNIFFVIDYQFSKIKTKNISNLNFETFLREYNIYGLNFNTLYQIKN